MEFGSENKIVNSGALKILGERVQIAACVGERRFVEFRRNKSAAFNADFYTVCVGCDGAQGFIRSVEALQKARMLAVVETGGAQKQMEGTKRANELQDEWLGFQQ